MSTPTISTLARPMWPWLLATGLIVAIAVVVMLHWSPRADPALGARVDSLRAQNVALRVAQHADSIASARRSAQLTQLTSTSTALLGLVQTTTTKLDRALAALPAKPALADSLSPRWMHRSLAQDTIITLDSMRFRNLWQAHQTDVQRLALADTQHVADTAAAGRWRRQAEAATALTHTAITQLDERSGCGLPHWMPCPTRRETFVSGVILGLGAAVVRH